ncbi:MAG: ABC transporter ATP-binding protein [Acidobacteriota bacterium]
MVIEVEGLRKQYGATTALRGIDLRVEEVGVVGILGPNGAGKTTLVEILEGLREPTSGRVSVLGLDPVRQGRELRERIGVQLQATALPRDLRVGEVVSLFRAFYDSSVQLEEVLERVDLLPQLRQRADTLSGGQRQRLVIGISLLHSPELVILDEPTTGLDPAARRSLHEVVRELRAQGRTVLLTTHYIEEAEHLCDRVIMIRDGEIVADGSPFELVGRSTGASTIWISVDGEMDPTPLLEAGVEPHGHQGDHYKFTTSDPTATVLAIGDLLRSQDLRLVDLRMKRPTLEDVYLELVGDPERDMLAGDVEKEPDRRPAGVEP